jgi:hypothetical protein
VGNEKNEYIVPDPRKPMKNVTNELSDAHKNSLKEEIMERLMRNSWRSYKTWLTRKYKTHSRNIKTLQIKNLS